MLLIVAPLPFIMELLLPEIRIHVVGEVFSHVVVKVAPKHAT